MLTCVKASHLRVLFISGLIAATPLAVVAQGSTFTTIDVTGAGTGSMQGTAAVGIDTAGDVAGTYRDGNGVAHGFVRSASGKITSFDAPGAGTQKNQGEGTMPTGMDTAGNIVGMYRDSSLVYHGFVRAASTGTITTFSVTGAGSNQDGSLAEGTKAVAINATAGIAGAYVAPKIVYYGFVRAPDGTISTFSAPDAGTEIYSAQGTQPTSINDSGEIAGIYIDSNNAPHGFVRSTNGTITEFNAPGEGVFTNDNDRTLGISTMNIDAAGDVAGSYFDKKLAQHGFLRAADGTFTTLDAPGAETGPCPTNGNGGVVLCGTFAVVLDASGDITGGYADSNGIIHGFLRPVKTGMMTSFDGPGVGSSGSMTGTLGLGINTSATGIKVVGTYADANLVLHGFIYTPAPALPATTTTLTPVPTPNPSIYGEPVTLEALVSSAAGAPPNGESVTFTINNWNPLQGITGLGSAPLSGGKATLTTSALPAGTGSITAVYGGDPDLAGSTSKSVSQTVAKANSYTKLTSSQNPSISGQSATFTAAVTGQFGGIATGSMTFYNGSTSLGSKSLSGNSAGLTTNSLPVGTDTIKAVYSGDSNFAGGTSNTVSQMVIAAPVPPPSFSPVAGTYHAVESVVLTDPIEGADIYYTTNQTAPTTRSTKYTTPIPVSQTTTIQAIAVVPGYADSTLSSATYTLTIEKGIRISAIPGGANVRNSKLASPVLFTQTGGVYGTVASGPMTGTAGGFTGRWWEIKWDAEPPNQNNQPGWSDESAISFPFLAGDVPEPNFSNSSYSSKENIFWAAGYAPSSTNPPKPKLGSALGNCTWYAFGRLLELGANQAQLSSLHGGAYQWASEANGVFTVDQKPAVHAIAQLNSVKGYSTGHVAVVESLNADGTITVTESSYDTDATSPWDVLWRHRTVSPSWFSNFIHVPL